MSTAGAKKKVLSSEPIISQVSTRGLSLQEGGVSVLYYAKIIEVIYYAKIIEIIYYAKVFQIVYYTNVIELI